MKKLALKKRLIPNQKARVRNMLKIKVQDILYGSKNSVKRPVTLPPEKMMMKVFKAFLSKFKKKK